MDSWIAAAALGTLLNGILIGTGLAAGLWLLLGLLPQSNATTRYAVWWAALLAVVTLPVLMLLPQEAAGQGIAIRAADPLIRLATPGAWMLWGLGAWLVIGTALVARIAWSFWTLAGLKRRALPLPDRYREQFERLLETHRCRRRIRLDASSQIGVPMAAGLFRPVILIPESLPEQLSEEEFGQVLVHEMAHLRRWDDWTNLAQKLAEALLFFHPAVLWIGRRLNLEREVACDDWVVSMTGAARPYAACLTKLLELGTLSRSPQLAHTAVARKRQVSHRIESLLSRGRPVSPRFSRIGVLAGSAALTLAVALGAQLTPIQVAQPALAELPSAASRIAAVESAYATPVMRPPVLRTVVAQARPPMVRYMVIQEWSYVVSFDQGTQVRSWVTILWTHPAPARGLPGRT